jgi:hypothetical protein
VAQGWQALTWIGDCVTEINVTSPTCFMNEIFDQDWLHGGAVRLTTAVPGETHRLLRKI